MSNQSKAASRALGVDAATKKLPMLRPAARAVSLALLSAIGSLRNEQGRAAARSRIRLSRSPSDRAGRGFAYDRRVSVVDAGTSRYGNELRIREFLARYRSFGQGQITVLAPPAAATSRAARAGLDEVRRALAAAGAGRALYIGTYPVIDPNLAAPIRLSFIGVKAKVKGPCGEWPDDLASGTSLDGWQNTTYWNFGCSNQIDIGGANRRSSRSGQPRGETPGDIETRMRAITKSARAAILEPHGRPKRNQSGGN